jgi:hypothetical protein
MHQGANRLNALLFHKRVSTIINSLLCCAPATLHYNTNHENLIHNLPLIETQRNQI